MYVIVQSGGNRCARLPDGMPPLTDPYLRYRKGDRIPRATGAIIGPRNGRMQRTPAPVAITYIFAAKATTTQENTEDTYKPNTTQRANEYRPDSAITSFIDGIPKVAPEQRQPVLATYLLQFTTFCALSPELWRSQAAGIDHRCPPLPNS